MFVLYEEDMWIEMRMICGGGNCSSGGIKNGVYICVCCVYEHVLSVSGPRIRFRGSWLLASYSILAKNKHLFVS